MRLHTTTFNVGLLLTLVQTATALPNFNRGLGVRQQPAYPDSASTPPQAAAPTPAPVATSASLSSAPTVSVGVAGPASSGKPSGSVPATPVAAPSASGASPVVGPSPSPSPSQGVSSGAIEVQDGQTGRLIALPPAPTDTGLKQIPDAAHPYMAPGPNDHRGPCPALNTLANHGYIPRNGIATPEEILTAVMEGFNMGHEFGSFIVSFATLARGNAFTGQLSIGGTVDEIPPLPFKIDGEVAGGIAMHGRFEGDVSSTRRDVHIGDAVNFQDDMFDEVLSYTGAWGDDGPDGKHSIVNLKTFQEFKFDAFNQDQSEDPNLEFHIGRQLTTYSEVAFILDLFANGTTGTLSIKAFGSIFRNQTFAENWFRRSSPAELDTLSATANLVRTAHLVSPGANINGTYVADLPTYTDFLCDGYADLAGNQLAYTLNSTTGIMAQNVQTLTDAIFKPFNRVHNCTNRVWPSGPAGV